MVAVAQDHLPNRNLIARFHLGRILQKPCPAGLLIDQQAQFVTQIQLVRMGNAGNETDGIETTSFGIKQVAPQHVRITWRRNIDSERGVISGMRTAHENAAIIQPKISIYDAKIPKPEAGRHFMPTIDARRFNACAEAVQIRSLKIPQLMILDLNLVIEYGLTG